MVRGRLSICAAFAGRKFAESMQVRDPSSFKQQKVQDVQMFRASQMANARARTKKKKKFMKL